MKQVALVAINDGCHDREKNLSEIFREKIERNGMESVKYNTSEIKDVLEKAKNADKVIVAFDAVRGMNPCFSSVARELYKARIKPVLLITSCDAEGADVHFAKNAIGEIWALENQALEPWDLNFDTLYFSYREMKIRKSPDIEEGSEEGTKKLIELLNR